MLDRSTHEVNGGPWSGASHSQYHRLMKIPGASTSWRRWTAADISELEAAERALQRFVDLATVHDDLAAWKLVYPTSRALWHVAPSKVLATFRSELEGEPSRGLEFAIVATARIILREAEGGARRDRVRVHGPRS
jgi:hypothetical protein